MKFFLAENGFTDPFDRSPYCNSSLFHPVGRPMYVHSLRPFDRILGSRHPTLQCVRVGTKQSADQSISGCRSPIRLPRNSLQAERSADVEHERQVRPNRSDEASNDSTVTRATPATADRQQVITYVTRRFEVDCSEYKPENVQVKIIDNRLLVEARQEQIDRFGSTRLEMSREFNLGDGYDLKNITCRMTADGSLQIQVPCAADQSDQPNEPEMRPTAQSTAQSNAGTEQPIESMETGSTSIEPQL